MNAQVLAAAKAYAALEPASHAAAPKEPAGAGGTDFARLLGGVVESAEATGTALDQSVAAQAAGKGDIVDVVTAVADAELTVQTIVSVRDRVISSYQEIMRMPI
jgi:flagellar hook-basal body complex protein FliE